MPVRSLDLLDHQSHVISGTGPCYLDFSSTEVSTSEAFHLKKLDQAIDENFKEETQNTPKHSNVLFTTNRLSNKKAFLEICCLTSFGSPKGQSLLLAEAFHPQNPSASFCL